MALCTASSSWPRMAVVSAVLMLSIGLGACTRCASARPFDSYVDEPTTLDAVEEFDDPPAVVAKIVKGSKQSTSGGGGCGHSPACIILLPVIVGEMAFPARYKEATITRDGSLVYEGVFKHNGEFVRAKTWDATTERTLQLIALPRLGKRIVVEVGSAKLGPDGKPGPLVRTSVQSQVDLLTPYEALLGTTDDKKAALIEMVGVLGHDGIALASKKLADPKLAADVKTGFAKRLCASDKSVIETPADRKTLLGALGTPEPATTTASAALLCYSPTDAEELERARAFIAVVSRAICEGDEKSTGRIIADVLSWAGAPKKRVARGPESDPVRAVLHRALSACPAERRSFVHWMLGGEVSETELRAMLLAQSLAARVAMNLDVQNDAHHELLVAALELGSPARSVILKALTTRKKTTERELDVLVNAFQTEGMPARDRAFILVQFDKASAAQSARVIRRLSARLDDAKDDEKPTYRVALAVLGRKDQQLAAARALVSYRRCVPDSGVAALGSTKPRSSANPTARAPRAKAVRSPECGVVRPRLHINANTVFDLRSLLGFGLATAGCDHDELFRAVELAAAEPNATRASICGEPPPK